MVSNLAVQLHTAGLAVFPCTDLKGPAVPRGASWKDPQYQYPTIQNWPSEIIGLPIPPGVIVIDLDTYKGATREIVDEALGVKLNWDAALIQVTMHGGQHYAFAVDWKVKFGSSLCGVKGLDTRTSGDGYIATGKGYTHTNISPFAMSFPASLPRFPDEAKAMLEDIPLAPSERAELPTGEKDIQSITAALRFISPECTRTYWVKIGLALRHHFHDDPDTGLAIFDAWSAGEYSVDGEAPSNYNAEHMDGQWHSFKPEGNTSIGTLFWDAAAAGWTPPAGIDTSAAFGAAAGEAAQVDVFDRLIDDIASQGGNPKCTHSLIEAVQALVCTKMQQGILLATLTRELKDADLLTKDVKAMMQQSAPMVPRVRGEYDKNDYCNAEIFVLKNYPDQTLVRSQKNWYYFTGKAWEFAEDEDINHDLAIDMIPSSPKTAVVNATSKMLELLLHSKDKRIGQNIPKNLIFVQNGVLDINTGILYAHSKDFFTTNIMPYDYNPGSDTPEWFAFLNAIFKGDVEQMALLQEWFGYMMSSSYAFHKILLMIGPPRCGKGTIGKLLKLLVGEQNFSGATMSSFASDASMEGFQTKTVAFVGDAAKNVPRNIVDAVTERLKGISAADDQLFSRKYKGDMTCQLPTRITIAANSLPRLFDDSGALAGRFLLMPMTESWLGREDTELLGRLSKEIEGIAAWSLIGLSRLRANGRFTEPQSSQAEMDYIRESYSPLAPFIEQMCVVTADEHKVSSTDVYDAYKAWCVLSGEDTIMNRRPFTSAFKDVMRGKCLYGSQRVGGAVFKGFSNLQLKEVGQLGNGSIPLTAVK